MDEWIDTVRVRERERLRKRQTDRVREREKTETERERQIDRWSLAPSQQRTSYHCDG